MTAMTPMISYFVRYRGSAADPAGFTSYYEARHALILKEFPGIRSLVLHTPATWNDPFSVRHGGSMLLAQMVFDSSSALDAALRSDARKQARDDFRCFTAFEGDVTHEAMAAKVVF